MVDVSGAGPIRGKCFIGSTGTYLVFVGGSLLDKIAEKTILPKFFERSPDMKMLFARFPCQNDLGITKITLSLRPIECRNYKNQSKQNMF
jgi:hypothetical protein